MAARPQPSTRCRPSIGGCVLPSPCRCASMSCDSLAFQIAAGPHSTPAHVGVTLALSRAVAEIAPSADHLLGRAPADPKLQASARDEVGRARLLDHVERVLVAHVDDRRANLDT